MSYPPFSHFTGHVIPSGSAQSQLVLLFNLSSKDDTRIPAVLSMSYKSHPSRKYIHVLQREKRGREGAWIVTERAGFSCVRGEFHTHALVACTGTRGRSSITAHYRLYLALFASPRAYTYEHTCLCANKPPNIKPTTGTMGPVYWQRARLTPGRHPRQSQRIKVGAENVTGIQDLLVLTHSN